MSPLRRVGEDVLLELEGSSLATMLLVPSGRRDPFRFPASIVD